MDDVIFRAHLTIAGDMFPGSTRDAVLAEITPIKKAKQLCIEPEFSADGNSNE